MTTDLHDLTGAYAGGALPPPERLRHEEHLTSCTGCRRETRELLETTALLGLAVSTAPPPRLRARVLAEAPATLQLPPLLPARRPARTATTRTTIPVRRRHLQVAACLAALIVGVSAYSGALNSAPRPADHTVNALQGAPEARTLTVTTTAATATVTLNPDNTAMTFTARGLPDLPADRSYQLWLVDARGPRPAGTLTATAEGSAAATLNHVDSSATLMLTEEPAGGSPAPTTQPILAVDLRQA